MWSPVVQHKNTVQKLRTDGTFGMFRDIIPVEALGEEEGLERGRGRQGLLPDFRLELPSQTGEPELRLVELKICGAVKRWYPRDGNLARRKKGVERRSAVSTGSLWRS